METTTPVTSRSRAKRAAVNALAFVGFFTLLFSGIGLAVYGVRVGGAGLGAAVGSITDIFRSDEPASLTVVEGPTSFVVEAQAPTTTPPVAPVVPESPTPTRPVAPAPIIREVRVPIEPFGDPDLTVRITAVGYLRENGDPSTFVESREVPRNRRYGAVKFTVTNTGTNVSGEWDLTAEVPSTRSEQTRIYRSQASLAPGQTMLGTIGFEALRESTDRTIRITVDSGRDVGESNEGNNADSATIDIER